FPVPSAFESTRKRQLREEARQKNAATVAQQAQRELERYEQRERYQAFLDDQTDLHVRKNITAPEYERLLRAQMKKIRDDFPQYRWPEPALRDFAVKKIREELATEMNLPTFEECLEQNTGRLF